MLPALLAISAHVADQPIMIDGTACHPTRLLVKLADVENTRSLDAAGVRTLQVFPQTRLAVVDAPEGKLRAARAALEGKPGIERVEVDRVASLAYTPNDPMWVDMWHAKDIKADLAWDLTKGTNGIVVAVIDTGVNAHPDLNANLWVNAAEVPANGIDDDGNGYIDDVNGYDFYYGDGTPNDVNGHGSACAGLVAAVQDNGIGVTGVAPKARIMCLKSSTDAGYFYDSANIGAYLYAEEMGAQVLSCSFFSDRVSQAERDAIDFCWQNGVLPVIAAGNSSSVMPYYPGGYENVLCVAATDQSRKRAGFSNYGTWVDVASPGTALRSTNNAGAYTSSFGGTSGATPQVAGLAALIWSAVPSLTNDRVRSIIEDTGVFLGSDFSNYGFIDCYQAARVALGLSAQVGKAPVVRYLTPLVNGTTIGLGTRIPKPARIYGRGFGAPNVVRVEVNGVAQQIIAQTRNWVDFRLPTGAGTVAVYVNGGLRKSILRPNLSATVWPLIEACTTSGGVSTGGFDQALNSDSTFVTSSVRSDGTIALNGTFRKVTSFGNPMKLVLRRHFTGTTTGTEKVFLYDWSSASYPYGSWKLISSGPVPVSPTLSTFTVTEPWRVIDPEGTVLLTISTTNDVAAGAKLNLDMIQLRDR